MPARSRIRVSVPPGRPAEPFDVSPPSLVPPDFQLVGGVKNWRASWSVIVTGRYSDSPFSTLLCYERDSGFAAFYQTDGAGGVQLLQEQSDLPGSWTFIVPECLAIRDTTDSGPIQAHDRAPYTPPSIEQRPSMPMPPLPSSHMFPHSPEVHHPEVSRRDLYAFGFTQDEHWRETQSRSECHRASRILPGA